MHLQTEVENMCNNIKNLNAENLKSANQQIKNKQSDNNMSQGSGRTGQCGLF